MPGGTESSLAPEHRARNGHVSPGRIGSESSVIDSGEVALWRAVIEQALHDACLPRAKATSNRWTAKSCHKRDRARATARAWLNGAERDFSLVCDFADLPAEAVQNHAYELIGTLAEKRSRSLRQVEWRAPDGCSLANPGR